MGNGTVNVGYPPKIGKPGGSDAYGSASAVQANLNSHTNNKSNPHGVTASQVGADPTGSAQAVQNNLDSHTSKKNNPHGVTASQIGAAASSHTHSASDINSGTLSAVRGGTGQTTLTPAVTTKGVRQIYAGTSDMTAGSSSLTTGMIYLVYE